jgi:betaine-aldehyde dehydrogenase
MEANTMSQAVTASEQPRRYGHWIGGRETGSPSIERHSPATGRLLATFAAGNDTDVDVAVKTARAAFEKSGWATRSGAERALVLSAWADFVAADAERLARIEAEEVGKPIKYARGEVGYSVQMIRYAAALAYQLKGDIFNNLGPGALGLVTREPRGIIGMIVPWNFPLVCLIQKLPFALATGCATVIKPSELTSGTTLEVARLAAKAGVPDGLINVVTGSGDPVGKAISLHPDVDMLSFTGSTTVGRQIAMAAAARIIPVSLELGGKGANIVFEDADINQALDGALFGGMLNQGQECCAGSRLLVHESIADGFLEQLVGRAAKIRVGDPLDDATDIGPMIHAQQRRRVMSFIEGAQGAGARTLIGGRPLAGATYDKGHFIGMSILDKVSPQMDIFRREVFGPVLTVTRFRTDDEALALANDTVYGLASGVWTGSLERAHRISAGIKTGTVYVNTYLESAMQLPFGGWRESGLGHEMGLEGLLEFTKIKSTFIKLSGRALALPHTA